MRRKTGFRVSWAMLTGLLVLLVAGLAGGGLWLLRGIQHQGAYQEAAHAVLRQGELITGYLASQPALLEETGSSGWKEFDRLFTTLQTLEPNLEYVSVSIGDATVFRRQAENIVQAPGAPLLPPALLEHDIRLSRRVIDVGGRRVPVMVFARDANTPAGAVRRLEVGLKRAAVEHKEGPAAQAIARMFRLSILTIAASFTVCAVMVVWLMRREGNRELMRRREEHLAFSGVMANGIAHDFRNPMSSARLDAQMLEREVAKGTEARPERASALAGRIRATLDRMDQTLKEFLYLSKPAGAPESIDMAAMLNGCLDMLSGRIERNGIRLEKRFPSEPLRVFSHESPLRRATVNILNNALQSMPDGGVLLVELTRSQRGVRVAISDSGPGIRPDMRDKVFEMFFTTRPEGTGLGLFMAKAAVENCGGTVTISDAETGGACFRVDLPDNLASKKER